MILKKSGIVILLIMILSLSLYVNAQDCPGKDFAGFRGSSCKNIDSQSECENSFAVSGNGIPVSCYFDSQGEDNDEEEGPGCYACGPNNFDNGFCTSECASCENIPSRDFVGFRGEFCRAISSQSECEDSFATTGEGRAPVPCYFDSDGSNNDKGEGIGCYACGPTNFVQQQKWRAMRVRSVK